MAISLSDFVAQFAGSLKEVDNRGPQHKNYQPGIGPHTESRTVDLVIEELKGVHPELYGGAGEKTFPSSRKRCDLVIPEEWAIELKLARPFGDNGRESQHWIKNLLYPYRGNTSAIGDCLKLLESNFSERKAVVIFGYEHMPPEISLEVAVESLEVIVEEVCQIQLGPRVESKVTNLIHPVHQQARVYGWEVIPQRDV
jgi:hypothetical protein